MSRLLSFIVVLAVFGCVYSQNERREQFKQIVGAVCKPNLSANKAKIIAECDKQMPQRVKALYNACVKEVFKVPKMTQPFVCYRAQPNGDQLKPCIERKASAASKRLRKTINFEELREQIVNEYLQCLGKAV